jgi:hypothetical protein
LTPEAREGPGIFISYRRGDAAGHAGRLFDSLSARFGGARVFMDLDGIGPGVDFWGRIREVLEACSVVLVLIGDEWLSEPGSGIRRLDSPSDFVRQEVAAALERPEVMTVPVLVHGASMPTERDLPEDIAALSRRNALELSDSRWRYDVDRLIGAIESVFAKTTSSSQEAVDPTAVAVAFEEVALDEWDRAGGQRRRRWPWHR